MKIDNKFRLVKKDETNSFIKQLKKIEWIYWMNRPNSVFMGTIFWPGLRKNVFSRNGFEGVEPGNNLYQFPDLYYDKKFLEKGLVYFDKYFKTHKTAELSDALEKIHSHHIKELKKIIPDQSIIIPQKVFYMSELFQDYIPYIWIIILLEEHFNRIIAKEVPKYIKGDHSKFIGDISIPVKKNIYVQMLDELKAGAPINEIKNKYGWMKSRDGFTVFYTEAEIIEIRKGIQETAKPEVNIPKELEGLAAELKELNFFRTSRTDKFYEYFGVARPLMEDMAKYIGVSFKELGDYDALSIILDRPQKYNKNFSYGLIDDRYLVSNSKLIDFAENKASEIKGNIAFKGLVRGIAKIVTHPNEISKVNKGDVLVAQMTFPSFIAAMQKAVAFVTDEGSITCHAAIVAREMKKPCIVGTKNATKILKDGDMVEVDANKGVVKVLK